MGSRRIEQQRNKETKFENGMAGGEAGSSLDGLKVPPFRVHPEKSRLGSFVVQFLAAAFGFHRSAAEVLAV